MNDQVVVDASLAFKWLVKEIHTDQADDPGRLWNSQGTRIAAPYRLPMEVIYALHRRVARGELTLDAATQRMRSLLSSGLELHQPPQLHRRALELASQLRQGAAYDAHYLALAETLGCELWTAESVMFRSVRSIT